MKENNQKILGIFFAAISIFIWGITFVSTRYLLKNFSSLEILFFRFLTAYIGLWFLHPKFEKIIFRDNIYFILAALTGLVLYQLSENIAIYFTNASNVSVIVSICPLFTAILNQIFFKEKSLSFFFIIGFVISIAGVILVCLNGDTALKFNPKGDLLALFAGVCWGFYSVVISILNKKKYNPVCLTRRIFFFSIVIMIPLSIFGSYIYGRYSNSNMQTDFVRSLYFIAEKNINYERFSNPMNWINILFLGFAASGICFTTWNKACEILGTVKVSCSIYMIPVVTIVFAFFTLGEKITLLGSVGALVTMAGLFISEKKKS